MCIFPERYKEKAKTITTLVSLVLMCFHSENTEVHEILRSDTMLRGDLYHVSFIACGVSREKALSVHLDVGSQLLATG